MHTAPCLYTEVGAGGGGRQATAGAPISLTSITASIRAIDTTAVAASRFAISVLLAKFSGAPWFRLGGQAVTAQAWGDAVAKAFIPDARLASLACALAILALIIALLWPLERRAIHLRV